MGDRLSVNGTLTSEYAENQKEKKNHVARTLILQAGRLGPREVKSLLTPPGFVQWSRALLQGLGQVCSDTTEVATPEPLCFHPTWGQSEGQGTCCNHLENAHPHTLLRRAEQ